MGEKKLQKKEYMYIKTLYLYTKQAGSSEILLFFCCIFWQEKMDTPNPKGTMSTKINKGLFFPKKSPFHALLFCNNRGSPFRSYCWRRYVLDKPFPPGWETPILQRKNKLSKSIHLGGRAFSALRFQNLLWRKILRWWMSKEAFKRWTKIGWSFLSTWWDEKLTELWADSGPSRGGNCNTWLSVQDLCEKKKYIHI